MKDDIFVVTRGPGATEVILDKNRANLVAVFSAILISLLYSYLELRCVSVIDDIPNNLIICY